VPFPILTAFGSVHNVPQLPADFTETFESFAVATNRVLLHAVIGGQAPPLLLLAGWPQNWFAWRYLMQSLAKRFTVVAADPRGVGLSERPAKGYDSLSQAADMFALMDVLGHKTFSMVGHDIGMWTGYTMAASLPGRIQRLAIGEAHIPGVSPSPPLISLDRRTSDFLWHFNFNRLMAVNEKLVLGREDIYFGHQFATKAASPEAVPLYARQFYIEQLRREPDTLRASFECYRALDISIPQHQKLRDGPKLRIPCLGFGGAMAVGDGVAHELEQLVERFDFIKIEECGHYPAEEKPDVLLNALLDFLV
jgi:pimeloyl-ACP methyl ester carboxylesterase